MKLLATVLLTVVIAHRGEHLHHAENTLAAFEAAIDAGADYFECDVRTTSDGRLVLMHDSTVDRTTKGKGRVSELRYEDLRKLGVPTFDEALHLAKGRIRVYVDYKEADPRAVVAAIDQAEMGDHVVIYGDPAKLSAIRARRPAWRLMPEAGTAPRLAALIETLHLRVAAFDARDFRPEIIEVARKAHIDIYVDRLGPDDNEAGWSEAISRGATGLQTDHPAEMVAYLRAKALHR